MRILPAIDLKDGRCVRLRQGDYDSAYQVAEDALETARGFAEQGARELHLVDLDGARDGVRQHSGIVRRMIEQTGLCVEFGGGVRSLSDIRGVLGLGVNRVVIGSAAVEHPAFVKEAVKRFGEHVAVGLDAKNGTVRTRGWRMDSGQTVLPFAKEMEALGVKTLIFTDIATDGMLTGPNFNVLRALRETLSCRLIASGGISSLQDIRRLRDMGIDGAIVGKAVYSGALTLRGAIEMGES